MQELEGRNLELHLSSMAALSAAVAASINLYAWIRNAAHGDRLSDLQTQVQRLRGEKARIKHWNKIAAMFGFGCLGLLLVRTVLGSH